MAETITFTEFVLPNGERRPKDVRAPDEIATQLKELQAMGFCFEIETLTTGVVSVEVRRVTKDASEEVLGHQLFPSPGSADLGVPLFLYGVVSEATRKSLVQWKDLDRLDLFEMMASSIWEGHHPKFKIAALASCLCTTLDGCDGQLKASLIDGALNLLFEEHPETIRIRKS